MTNEDLEKWITERGIEEVECLIPDMSGVARGKIIPAKKFISGLGNQSLRMPEEIFILTVTGRYVQEANVTSQAAVDIYLRPDPSSIRMVPWYSESTAQVICDCYYLNNEPVDVSPRFVLQRVLKLYEEKGWKPIIAPEPEFYLVEKNTYPDYPLEPPVGRSGRKESGGQAYGIDSANEFDPIVEDIYDYCEPHGIDIGTLSHESGPAKLEINFNHGDPLDLADQVFLFKRAVRQAAIKHDVYATFMAKPHEDEPGSSMHIHQSVVETKTGKKPVCNQGR